MCSWSLGDETCIIEDLRYCWEDGVIVRPSGRQPQHGPAISLQVQKASGCFVQRILYLHHSVQLLVCFLHRFLRGTKWIDVCS